MPTKGDYSSRLLDNVTKKFRFVCGLMRGTARTVYATAGGGSARGIIRASSVLPLVQASTDKRYPCNLYLLQMQAPVMG